jgi:hypothetical protein
MTADRVVGGVDVLAEFDRLLETQARLQFAKAAYSEDEATNYGISLLDFIRKHGVTVRAALANARGAKS